MTKDQKLLYWAIFAILLGVIFRTASDMHDGLSLRADGVGWWSWHLIGGGIARDLWQFALVFYISLRTMMRENIIGRSAVFYIGVNLLVSGIISIYWHNFIYNWTIEHLHFFHW